MDMGIDSVNDNGNTSSGTDTYDIDMNGMLYVDTSTMRAPAMAGSMGELYSYICYCYVLCITYIYIRCHCKCQYCNESALLTFRSMYRICWCCINEQWHTIIISIIWATEQQYAGTGTTLMYYYTKFMCTD
jgi:hypothetical protein